MWVSWVVARQLVVGLVVVALAFIGLAVSLFLLNAPFAACSWACRGISEELSAQGDVPA